MHIFLGYSNQLAKLMISTHLLKVGNTNIGGCALSIREENCGHFSCFSLVPEFRRNGIGSCTIYFAEKYLKLKALY